MAPGRRGTRPRVPRPRHRQGYGCSAVAVLRRSLAILGFTSWPRHHWGVEKAGADVLNHQGRGPTTEAVWRAHLPLVVTAALSGLFFIKVLVVSRGNYTTAFAMLQTAGPGDVASAIALAAVPLVLLGVSVVAFSKARAQAKDGRYPWIPLAVMAVTAYMSMFLLPSVYSVLLTELTVVAAGYGVQTERGRWAVAPLAVAAAVAALASLFLLPPFVTFGLVTVSVFACAWRWRPIRRPIEGRHGERPAGAPTDLSVALAVLLSVMVLSDIIGGESLWLPGQVLKIKGGREFTAYVLDEGQDHVTILRDSDRIVMRFDPAVVTFVEFCHPQGTSEGERPLVHALLRSDASDYRPCPVV